MAERKTETVSSSQMPIHENPESNIRTQSHVQDSGKNYDSKEDIPYQVPLI